MSEDLNELFGLYVGQYAEPVITAAYTTWVRGRRDAVARQFENRTFKLKFNSDDPTESRLDGTYNVDWNNQRDNEDVTITRALNRIQAEGFPPLEDEIVAFSSLLPDLALKLHSFPGAREEVERIISTSPEVELEMSLVVGPITDDVERIDIDRFSVFYSTQSDPNHPTRRRLVSLPHPDFSMTEMKRNETGHGSYCADWYLGTCEATLVVNHKEFEWGREYPPMKAGVIHNSWVEPETEEQRTIFNDLAAETGTSSTSQV